MLLFVAVIYLKIASFNLFMRQKKRFAQEYFSNPIE
jgi:hypothetical protein